jgi:DNA-binding NarL/FixJ family response regulator
MSNLRILLADDHALVRAGIRALLMSMPGTTVVGEAANGTEALRLIKQLRPDIVLMDVSMRGLNGLEATRRAIKQHPRSRILMLSMHADSEYVRQALVAGASGYLLKSAAPSELEMAIAAVARGAMWLSPAISRTIVAALVDGRRVVREDELTSRQREILQLTAEGHSAKQIAKKLEISAKTVDAHRGEIMRRLDIHNVAGLVHYAIRAGIVRE